MTQPQHPIREINPTVPPVPLSQEARDGIGALVRRQRKASGLLMRLITFAGGQVEDGMKLLPASFRTQIDGAARNALTQSYEMASRTRIDNPLFPALTARLASDRSHKVLAAISGALGGLGGLPTALAELPVATTVIFRAVQGVALAHGEDPGEETTRIECLRVFGSGGPTEADDGVDTSFLGARLSLSGVAVNKIISKIAPRFATVLSQKLASQAIPLLGAAAGAGTNYAFIDYYVEMAHVHFGLRKLAREHGEAQVLEEFHRVLAESTLPARKGWR
jgi:MFS family permease